MKRVICVLEDDGALNDVRGNFIMNVAHMNLNFDDPDAKQDLSKLMSLGATPDDLIKMKANGLL